MDNLSTTKDLLEEIDRARVRAARGTGKVRISLRDLAAATGVPRASLANYLSGSTLMPADVLDAVVRALGITEARAWATAWERATAEHLRPVRADRAGTAAPRPRQLPACVTGFTGREPALAALDALLAGDHGPGVVIGAIVGTAGVGKTALAVRWAHRMADRFPDGQLFANLRGYDPGEPAAAGPSLERFLRALGVRTIPSGLEERAALYRSSLSGKRLLLVLDNAGSADQIRPLLPGTADCLVLVTSRDALSGLVARDGAYRLGLERLPDREASQLLVRLLGTGRTSGEPEACAEMIRLCAGLPLALRAACELIARRPAASLAELAAGLADPARTLDLLAIGDPLADVRCAFSWSLKTLPAPAARLFRLLGLVPGPDVDGWAAARLADVTPAEARRWLGVLNGSGMLETAGADRYRMHGLLRVYAREVVAASESAETRRAALTRLFDWQLATAGAAVRLICPWQSAPAWAVPAPDVAGPVLADAAAARIWLHAERAGLRATIAHAAEGWPDHAARLAQLLDPFFAIRTRADDQPGRRRPGSATEPVTDQGPQPMVRTVHAFPQHVPQHPGALWSPRRESPPPWRRVPRPAPTPSTSPTSPPGPP